MSTAGPTEAMVDGDWTFKLGQASSGTTLILIPLFLDRT